MAGYITVLIQKSNPEGDWGFKMGPADPLSSVVITQIDQSCVAAELLEAGDRIIEIEGMETSKLSREELQTILGNPSKRLSMVVLKKNTPKELLSSVRKTTREETSTVEETKEEIEKLKEYEVVLEVDPRDSLEDILKSVKAKLERGEELDAKEMKFISTYNTRVQESTATQETSATTGSTKQTIQRGHRPYFGNQLINTEILKRKQKFLKEQRKEESVKIEQTKTEKEKMEEKKKKSSSFWTDPPSDLKKVIERNQFWQRNETTNEPVSTSAIFSHLNDLHNIQRKTSAREEKRQFWESCRKKYGWDPPESKYDLSHRLRLQDDITRSRSCEPEHLDSRKKGRGHDFRETNPFFSPSPTNPFYEECRTQSLEQLSRGYSSAPKYMFNAKPVNLKEAMKSTEIGSAKSIEKLSIESQKTKTENREISSEASREDFNSKCEFFERATGVPITSYVKNAQDIVSERLGTPRKSSLKKPSDFINEMMSEQKRASLSRSNSKEEESSDLNKSALESKITGSSMETQQKEEISSEDKTFSSMIKASATSMQRRASEKKTQMESISNISERNRQVEESAMFKEAEKQANLKEDLPGKSRENLVQMEAQRQIIADNSNITSIHSESFQKNADRIEAEMNESIEKIKSESEKLRSLAFGGGNIVTGAFDQRLGTSKPEVQPIIIPDSTAFPGMQAPAKVSSSTSGEFHKRSFVETSYEKVTKTGTPFENVESAWRREFRVATPSGFYDNNTEEVFKQEAHTEGFREAKIVEVKTGDDFVDESYREITSMEGSEPIFEYTSEYRMAAKIDPNDPAVRQLVYKHYRGILGKYNEKANSIVSTLPRDRVRQDQGITDKLESMIRQSSQIQNSSTDGPSPSLAGNGAPPPPPPPCAGSIPAVRIASELGARKPCEPPAAIQNAMMTKDKKPFTYTPGGLNLNEIRSPRMARRISRNAQTDDSCTHSQPQAAVSPPGPLPPAAVAAMQPQIAIPVFPPGGVPPAPPPPPPPPATAQAGTGVPPPPPAPGPPPPPPLQMPAITRPQDFPRPEFLSDIASHPPLRPVGQPPRSSYEPQAAPPLQVQLKPVSPKPSPEPPTSQQVPFVPRPPPTTEAAQQNSAPAFQQARTPQPTPPPIQPVTPPLGSRTAPPTPPVVQSQPVRAPPTPPIQQVRPPVTPPIVGQRQPTTPPIQPQRTPPTPPTPSLNKSPAPWLTSKPAQKESVPPWTMRQPSVETPPPTPPIPVQQTSQQGHQPVTRVIPIQIEGRETTPTPKTSASPQPYYNPSQAPQQYAPSPPPPYQYPAQTGNGQQHRYVQPPPNFPSYTPPSPQAYVPPPQYQQQGQQPYVQPSQSEQIRTRIIPIQLEGADNKMQPAYYSQNSCPAGNPLTKTQNGDAVDGRKFQTQTSYSGNPTQSRSFRVLQKITGSDDDAQVPIPPPQGDIILVNRVFPPQERLDESEY